ncbi:MAG: DUF418 domain-containing protein [Ilumatobacteraceae bacterium]|nr:DUF418 domain-containing protein [Ilumatobacteraceae bacterium]
MTRALALSGVVALNFHTYLNGTGASSPLVPSVWERLFNPDTGPLTTRFAAVFVCVAGVAIALMERSAGGASASLSTRLVRRGFILYAAGFVLEWFWPGTIIFYYGAYFMLAALLIHLSSRQLIALCAPIALVPAIVQGVRAERLVDGKFTSWLDPPSIDSVNDLLVRTFLSYTHPVFPWLVFLCVGIVLGRNINQLPRMRRQLLLIAVSLIVGAYATREVVYQLSDESAGATFILSVSSTDPDATGIPYTVGIVGTTLLVIVVISYLCETRSGSPLVTTLTRVGQTSLTMYIFHVVFYELVVEVFGAASGTGLDTALVLSLACIALGFTFVLWWTRYIGQGPIERLYRLLAP